MLLLITQVTALLGIVLLIGLGAPKHTEDEPEDMFRSGWDVFLYRIDRFRARWRHRWRRKG